MAEAATLTRTGGSLAPARSKPQGPPRTIAAPSFDPATFWGPSASKRLFVRAFGFTASSATV